MSSPPSALRLSSLVANLVGTMQEESSLRRHIARWAGEDACRSRVEEQEVRCTPTAHIEAGGTAKESGVREKEKAGRQKASKQVDDVHLEAAGKEHWAGGRYEEAMTLYAQAAEKQQCARLAANAAQAAIRAGKARDQGDAGKEGKVEVGGVAGVRVLQSYAGRSPALLALHSLLGYTAPSHPPPTSSAGCLGTCGCGERQTLRLVLALAAALLEAGRQRRQRGETQLGWLACESVGYAAAAKCVAEVAAGMKGGEKAGKRLMAEAVEATKEEKAGKAEEKKAEVKAVDKKQERWQDSEEEKKTAKRKKDMERMDETVGKKEMVETKKADTKTDSAPKKQAEVTPTSPPASDLVTPSASAVPIKSTDSAGSNPSISSPTTSPRLPKVVTVQAGAVRSGLQFERLVRELSTEQLEASVQQTGAKQVVDLFAHAMPEAVLLALLHVAHGCKERNPSLAACLLEELPRAGRFSLLVMFLDKKELNQVEQTLWDLSPTHVSVASLEKLLAAYS